MMGYNENLKKKSSLTFSYLLILENALIMGDNQVSTLMSYSLCTLHYFQIVK